MLRLCKVTKVKVFFLMLVYVFNFDLFKFSAAILEKGLLLFFSVLINSRLVSKFQIFTLFSGRHIGVPRMYTNIAFSHWAL